MTATSTFAPDSWSDSRSVLALRVAQQACRMTRQLQDLGRGLKTTKRDSSPVTVADLAVQALVVRSIQLSFPDEVVMAEEASSPLLRADGLLDKLQEILQPYHGELSCEEILACFQERRVPLSGSFWVLDPIDGTKGFLRGEQFAIALAWMEQFQVQIGILGCPRLCLQGTRSGGGVLAAAYRGRGSWQMDNEGGDWQRLRVSSQTDSQHSRILRSTEASHTNEEQLDRLVERLNIDAPPVRMDSQAKYVVLARGEAEAVLRLLSVNVPDYKEKIWDQAAGSLLVEEAGGRITDLAGRPLDFSQGSELLKNSGVVASHERLHAEFVEAIQALTPSP